jgi:hypothetical protein
MGCSLLTLLESAPALIISAISALASATSALSDAAADALCELMTPSNTVLAPSAEKTVQMTLAVAEQLLQVAGALRVAEDIGAGTELDERQHNTCRVLCAFAERAVDVVAQTDGRLLPLVQLIFTCLGGELRVAELTIDFWSGLQDTPLHLRHEALRQPLFKQVATRTMQRCTLPASFTTWADEGDLDEDEFERFREQSAQEIFVSCLQLLHADFIGSIAAPLEAEAPSWQSFELVCYIVRCLHAEIKTTLNSDADGSELPAPLLAAHKEAVRTLLLKLLAPAANNGAAFDNQPTPLLTSAVRLYGSFGKVRTATTRRRAPRVPWRLAHRPSRRAPEACVHVPSRAGGTCSRTRAVAVARQGAAGFARRVRALCPQGARDRGVGRARRRRLPRAVRARTAPTRPHRDCARAARHL